MRLNSDIVNCKNIANKRKSFYQIGQTIGAIVEKKNKQYGNAINSTSQFLELLYPNGITVEQYEDLGLIIRIFDKIKRIANGNKGEENAYMDIAGYGILGAEKGVNNNENT